MKLPSGSRPPVLARRLLRSILHPEDRRFALADLDEEFDERVASQGRVGAIWWYRRQVVTSVIPVLVGRLRRSRRPTRRKTRGLLEDARSDLLLGLRMMIRSPLAMALAVLSLGLGIGGVTVVIATVYGLVLAAPVGLDDPTRLVTVYRTDPAGHAFGGVSYADYLDLRSEIDDLGGVALVDTRSASFSTTATAVPTRPILTEEVSGNYFSVLGTEPFLGRVFTADEVRNGADVRVAVIGYDVWLRDFGGRRDAVGETVRIDGTAFSVIGVAPRGMKSRRVPLPTDLVIPLGSLEPGGVMNRATREDRAQRDFLAIGRLKQGATIASVRAQAEVLADRLARAHPSAWAQPGAGPQELTVVSEERSRTNPRARALLLTAGAFFFVVAAMILLLAATNVAGLYVARAQRRRAEIALRASLGASRSRIVRMLLAEGVWPGVLGTALGLGLAFWATHYLSTLSLPIQFPARLDLEMSLEVLAAACLLALSTTLAFSLLPAIGASRADVGAALKESRVGTRRRAFSLRSGLVVVQCATSAALLVGAMLFVRALSVASAADIGFRHDGVAVATHELPDGVGAAEGVQAIRELRDRLVGRPGVDRVAFASSLELTLFQTLAPLPLDVQGFEPPTDAVEEIFHNAVSPGYLEMLRIPILTGRSLEETDDEAATPVAVVNETFAGRYWPQMDPIGRTFTVDRGDIETSFTVVGVARDGKYQDFDDDPMPYFWSSIYQDFEPHFAIAVSGDGAAREHLPLLREIAPRSGTVQLMPPAVLSEQVGIQYLHLRVLSRMLGWGGLFGLLLAATGIYGIVSFAVTQRAREVAVRLALGAESAHVVRSVALDGMRLAGIGLVVGVLTALSAARLVGPLLYEVSTADPSAIGVSVGVLFAVALVASVVPARRITRTDPMSTLRSE